MQLLTHFLVAIVIQSEVEGDLKLELPDIKQPFTHLSRVPGHVSAHTLGKGTEVDLSFGSVVNRDTVSRSGDWVSRFDAVMLFAKAGIKHSFSERFDIGLELEAGNIETDDGIILSRNTEGFLKNNKLDADLSSLILETKLLLFDGPDVKFALSNDLAYPAGGSDTFLTLGTYSHSHSFLASVNHWRNHYISYNFGVTVPHGENVFKQHLRPSMVKSYSGSYMVENNRFATAIIYETSTPLLRRPETLNDRVSSSSLFLRFKAGEKLSYHLILSRGTTKAAYDFSVYLGQIFSF